MTREHVIPLWLAELLRDFGDSTEPAVLKTTWVDLPAPATSRELSSRCFEVVARAVCNNCNSGWMAALEESCKPVMTLMIRGQQHHLDARAQLQLARWAAKTSAMLDVLQRGSVVLTDGDLDSIARDGTAPKGWLIRLGYRTTPEVSPLHIYCTTCHAVPTGAGHPADDQEPNGFVATLSFGYLLINVAGGPGFSRTERWRAGSDRPMAVWPPTPAGLTWPPVLPIVATRDDLLAFHNYLFVDIRVL